MAAYWEVIPHNWARLLRPTHVRQKEVSKKYKKAVLQFAKKGRLSEFKRKKQFKREKQMRVFADSLR